MKDQKDWASFAPDHDATVSVVQDVRFPHGTEVRFDCLSGDSGKIATSSNPLRSWKIACLDGQWTGISMSCGNPLGSEDLTGKSSFNASCPFRPPSADSAVVAFADDRQLTTSPDGHLEMFEPGAEVIYRCVDIGKIITKTNQIRMKVHSHLRKRHLRNIPM